MKTVSLFLFLAWLATPSFLNGYDIDFEPQVQEVIAVIDEVHHTFTDIEDSDLRRVDFFVHFNGHCVPIHGTTPEQTVQLRNFLYEREGEVVKIWIVYEGYKGFMITDPHVFYVEKIPDK
jgi:hypothetical protein